MNIFFLAEQPMGRRGTATKVMRPLVVYKCSVRVFFVFLSWELTSQEIPRYLLILKDERAWNAIQIAFNCKIVIKTSGDVPLLIIC